MVKARQAYHTCDLCSVNNSKGGQVEKNRKKIKKFQCTNKTCKGVFCQFSLEPHSGAEYAHTLQNRQGGQILQNESAHWCSGFTRHCLPAQGLPYII
jgi:hypothetical protein